MRRQRPNGLARVLIMAMTLVMVAIIAGVIMHLTLGAHRDPTVAVCPGGPGQEDDFIIDLYPGPDMTFYVSCVRDTEH